MPTRILPPPISSYHSWVFENLRMKGLLTARSAPDARRNGLWDWLKGSEGVAWRQEYSRKDGRRLSVVGYSLLVVGHQRTTADND
jgi:hypothetical protein